MPAGVVTCPCGRTRLRPRDQAAPGDHEDHRAGARPRRDARRDRRPRRAGGRPRPVGRPGQRDAGDRAALRAPGRGRPVRRPPRPHRRPRDHGRDRQEEGDADSLADAESELARIKKSVEVLEVRTLLSGEYDAREALITIRAGAGGVDAADFAEMLMRMYTRWAEQHKYPVEVFDTSYAEEAGLKSATFAIHAPYAYGTLERRRRHPPPRADQPVRQPGPPADQLRRGRGGPGARADRRDRHPGRGHPHRRLPLRWSRRPVGQHHRLRGPSHAHPDRHRGQLPEREEPAPEQGQRDGGPQGQAPRAGRRPRRPRTSRTSRATCRRRGATRCATTC